MWCSPPELRACSGFWFLSCVVSSCRKVSKLSARLIERRVRHAPGGCWPEARGGFEVRPSSLILKERPRAKAARGTAQCSRGGRRAQRTGLLHFDNRMSSAIRSTLSSLARRWSALSEARAETDAARRFWDEGAPGEPEDHYWGAQPLVRRAM